MSPWQIQVWIVVYSTRSDDAILDLRYSKRSGWYIWKCGGTDLLHETRHPTEINYLRFAFDSNDKIFEHLKDGQYCVNCSRAYYLVLECRTGGITSISICLPSPIKLVFISYSFFDISNMLINLPCRPLTLLCMAYASPPPFFLAQPVLLSVSSLA